MITTILKKIIPESLKNKIVTTMLGPYRIWQTKRLHQREIKRIRKIEKIKVAFLLINEAMWKCERLYFLMKEDERYEPVIFICPFITYGDEIMKREMLRTYKNFKSKKYNIQMTLQDDGTYFDINKEFQPDLVFFTTSVGHSLRKYLIPEFMHKLTCYVPYGFTSSIQTIYYNQIESLCWKVFTETPVRKEMAKAYALRKGDNFLVTGYPGIDNLIDPNYQPENIWKPQEKKKKKIIWAPHHSIKGLVGRNIFHSTFLNYAELMLDLAKKHKDNIQISFKPHPSLKGKLKKLWGEERTNLYYQQWEVLPNGQLNDGEYSDLFLTSDAMIHDSGSFLLEYLFVQKPVMYLVDNIDVDQMNDLGKEGLNVMNLGYKKEDIEQFIKEVVIMGNDKQKTKRETFVNNKIMPPNGKLASENIYYFLKNKLDRDKPF